jgi:hypothetical protein
MDPDAAIGTTGAVIGMAGFGLQLSAAINKCYSQIIDPKQNLQAVVDVFSTPVVLERTYESQRVEEENLERVFLFSNTALDMKDMECECLLIFLETRSRRNQQKQLEGLQGAR